MLVQGTNKKVGASRDGMGLDKKDNLEHTGVFCFCGGYFGADVVGHCLVGRLGLVHRRVVLAVQQHVRVGPVSGVALARAPPSAPHRGKAIDLR